MIKIIFLSFLLIATITHSSNLYSFTQDIDIEEALQYLSLEEIKKAETSNHNLINSSQIKNDFKRLKEQIPLIINLKKSGMALSNILISLEKNHKTIEKNELRLLKAHLSRRLKVRSSLESVIDKYYPFLLDTSSKKELKFSAIMMMLSSSLIILDDYQDLIKILKLEQNIYEKLGLSRPKNSAQLERLRLEITEYKRKEFVFKKIHSIRYFLRHQSEITIEYFHHPIINFLNKIITSSPSYKTYIKETRTSVFSKILNYFDLEFLLETNIFNLFSREEINKLTFLFSKLFADITGDIEWRKGKLYNSIRTINQVKNSLLPMDILLEKAPFRLTDSFIPGHWGHNAIWIGNEKQLKKLNIWNHPEVEKYHQQIRAGKSILEALRPKVTLNSVTTFMNLDDISIIRKSNLTDLEKSDRIIKALRTINKEYDFNFDLKTNKELFCSEVVFKLFSSTKWQTQYIFGRTTISPDDITSILFDSNDFKIILFYNDGKEISKIDSFSHMKRLLFAE